MEILTVEQAAEFLHMHPTTVSTMAKRKEIPCAKPGKRYVFIKADLIEWIRSQYQKESEPCPSTPEPVSIGLTSVTKEGVSARLQGLQTKRRRRDSTTN